MTTPTAAGRAALVLLAALCLVAGSASAASAPEVAPPNDPLFRHQWHLHAIQIPAAWAISRGEGATVAVLDTGVAFEDRGRYRQAPDFAGTRFVAGYDFVDDDPYPDDVPPPDGRRSHGTLMAGLIAQAAGNALGGAGVAPQATIMPVRVLKPDLGGSPRAIARGLRFAVDHGADIVNMSIAGPARSPVIAAAIGYAVSRGVTIVAAAGNDGADAVSWPAADPRVIAVGGVSRNLTRATYSNFGADLDLVAPAGAGERVDSGRGPSDGVVAQTLIGGPASFCLCFTASTSAAAAQVSGVAALLAGSGRATGRAEIRVALLGSARDLGPRGRDDEYGAGLVQAWSALTLGDAAPAAPARKPAPEPARAWWIASLIIALACVAGVAIIARRRHARAR